MQPRIIVLNTIINDWSITSEHQGKLRIFYSDKKHEEAFSKSVLANIKLLRDILKGIRSLVFLE